MSLPWFWFFIRATGLVAWGAAWLSMLFGLFVSSRGAGGQVGVPASAELHRQWSLVTAGAALVHALASVLAPEGGVPALAVLLPFVSPTERVAIALGTVSLWGFGALVASDRLRRLLGPGGWRALHASAFATWIFALAHTLWIGTDLHNPVVKAVVLGSAASVGAAFLFRVAHTLTVGAGAAARGGGGSAKA